MMRDFSEPASYSFQDFPKTFNAYNPPYDETYRTRDSEANSSSFFHWKTNSGIQQNEWTFPSAFPLVSDRITADPSFQTPDCSTHVADNAADQMATIPQLNYQQVDGSSTLALFKSFESLPSDDASVRIKEEPETGINNLPFSGNAFLSFPSFQEGITQQAEQTDSNQDFFMQLLGKNDEEVAPIQPQPVTTNLEQIIDECMTLDNQYSDEVPEIGNIDTDFANWALGLPPIYDASPYPQEARSCRWQDCSFTCKTQEELVSLNKHKKAASIFGEES